MKTRRLLILQNHLANQRFLGVSLEGKYEVNYAPTWQKAEEIAKTQNIDGLIFTLIEAVLPDFNTLPTQLRLFCIVLPSQELPLNAFESPLPLFFLPSPLNLLELETVLRRAFTASPLKEEPEDAPETISSSITALEKSTVEIKEENETKTENLTKENPAPKSKVTPFISLALSSNQEINKVPLIPFSLIHNTVLDLVHSVKNPLVSIQTFAQMLPEKINDPEFRENFSRFVNSEINLINTRLNNFLDTVSLPNIFKEEFSSFDFLQLLKEQLLKVHPHLKIEIASSPLLLCGNYPKLVEAMFSLWSIVLEVVKEPVSLLISSPPESEQPKEQNYQEFYFSLKFKSQYIDMELDFLSTVQRPKGIEILYALRLIEEMDGALKIALADKDTFLIKLNLPVSQQKIEPAAAERQ